MANINKIREIIDVSPDPSETPELYDYDYDYDARIDYAAIDADLARIDADEGVERFFFADCDCSECNAYWEA
jgi:hypothetical protein